jgi:hypothetical protein
MTCVTYGLHESQITGLYSHLEISKYHEMWQQWDHLETLDRLFQLATLVAGHLTTNERPSHSTSTPKGLLGRTYGTFCIIQKVSSISLFLSIVTSTNKHY